MIGDRLIATNDGVRLLGRPGCGLKYHGSFMKAKALMAEFREAAFVGEVTGDRRTYFVFATPEHYLLVTTSGPLAGNFNLVRRQAVEHVGKRFGGEKNLTSGSLLKRIKKPQYVRDRFDALRILYVLEAMGEASRRRATLPARGFLFNIRKPKGRRP